MIASSNNPIPTPESFSVNKDEAGGAAVSEGPPRDALHLLNSILELSEQRKVSPPQVMIILDALAAAQDPALVSRFPAVLALCGRRGIELNSSNLLGRYWESNPKRQNLEKLLFVSAELFRRENMAAPLHLRQIAESLKARHAALAAADYVQLTGGPRVAVADMLSALKQFAAERPPSRKLPAPEVPRGGSVHLGARLELLFSEKQKELIFKKVKQQPMTKTEREYYSRVVKKKLAAIAAPEIQELATALTQAGSRKDP
jgi:hypothetical protein